MTTNVLILCTHNSARSVLGEGMLNHLAARAGRDVRAFSAGSAPSGRIHPMALEVLSAAGVTTGDFQSKSWDEYIAANAPRMRIVITVCDNAAKEACPYWPGAPVQVHWGYPDPSKTFGTDENKRAAFELTRQAIGYRMLQLLQLPLEDMDDATLRSALTELARK
jgi:arsenate reductase